MKHIALILVLILVAVPALARVQPPDETTHKSQVGYKVMSSNIIAACAPSWVGSNCTQEDLDAGFCLALDLPWDTVNCTPQRVTDEFCLARDQGRLIPKPSECRQWYDARLKSYQKALADVGLDGIQALNSQSEEEGDPIEDDDAP